MVVWCGVNQKIVHFSEAFIPPSVHSFIHPFLQIILVLNMWWGMEFNQFRSPNISDDICLLFCLIPRLWFSYTYQGPRWRWIREVRRSLRCGGGCMLAGWPAGSPRCFACSPPRTDRTAPAPGWPAPACSQTKT